MGVVCVGVISLSFADRIFKILENIRLHLHSKRKCFKEGERQFFGLRNIFYLERFWFCPRELCKFLSF